MLAGCAETRIYDQGQLACVIQGDATNVTFKTGSGVYFHADLLNHSKPTGTAYAGGASLVGGLGSAVAGAAAVIK